MNKPKVVALLATLGFTLVMPFRGWAQNYTVKAVSNGGGIRGSVTYTGEAPQPKALAVTDDQEVCGQTKYSTELIVNGQNHGIQNVVVSITDISEGKDWSLSNEAPALDQQGCSFNPHVLVVPAGESFIVLNNDGILHNVHTRSRMNRPINKAQPRFLKELTMKLDEAEFVRVSCDVHSWMEGWIVVAEHPYYAVSDENGAFQMEDVPPGNYTLEVWHEKLGTQTRTITVPSGNAVQVDVTFSANQ